MLLETIKKCGLLLAIFLLKFLCTVKRILVIFTMTCTKRDNFSIRILDSTIFFLICVLYLCFACQEIRFILSIFPNLFGIENLIVLGNVGIVTTSTFVSFVSFQRRMDKLRRLIDLFDNVPRNRILKYKFIHLCATLMVLFELFLLYTNGYFASRFVKPTFEIIILSICVFAREFSTFTPHIEFCLWLNVFKTVFRKLTIRQAERMITQSGSFLLSDRYMNSDYKYREGTRQYIRDVRLLMKVKYLMVETYGFTVILNLLNSFSAIIFNIHTLPSTYMYTKVPVCLRFAIDTFKIGFVFWSAQSTTLSVRIANCLCISLICLSTGTLLLL